MLKMSILLDSYALIEYTRGSSIGAKIMQIIDEADEVFTTSANLYETRYRLEETIGEKNAEDAIERILVTIVSLPVDDRVALRAGKLRKKFAGKKMGAVDFFVLAAADVHGLKIVSGDPHFKGLANVIFIDEKI